MRGLRLITTLELAPEQDPMYTIVFVLADHRSAPCCVIAPECKFSQDKIPMNSLLCEGRGRAYIGFRTSLIFRRALDRRTPRTMPYRYSLLRRSTSAQNISLVAPVHCLQESTMSSRVVTLGCRESAVTSRMEKSPLSCSEFRIRPEKMVGGHAAYRAAVKNIVNCR
ncbi:hypothetical protein DENSPDRAFT_829419 [Dentipellis sp. KUC8613]|nr:hypothetical protein DENSPDRAFT_829419 [Dentipellis sp. KUC8613]